MYLLCAVKFVYNDKWIFNFLFVSFYFNIYQNLLLEQPTRCLFQYLSEFTIRTAN